MGAHETAEYDSKVLEKCAYSQERRQMSAGYQTELVSTGLTLSSDLREPNLDKIQEVTMTFFRSL